MPIPPILTTGNTYAPSHTSLDPEKPTKNPAPAKKPSEPEQDSITTSKKLSADQLEKMQEEQLLSFKQMLYGMLNTQGGHAASASGLELNKDLFSKLNISPSSAADAASAISEDGPWGVKAVAGRIMDMAVALSGGDPSKINTLRDAVDRGFQAAGAQWGGSMPSITGDTHTEINKQFDYWEKNGSLDGYGQ